KGTKKKTRQQIRDEFSQLKAQVFFFGAGNNIIANVTTTRANLVPTLRLVAEVLKEPAFDPKEFEVLQRQQLAGLDQQKSDPGSVAFTAFQRATSPYPKGHPLYVQTIEEQIAETQAVTVDELKKLYTD